MAPRYAGSGGRIKRNRPVCSIGGRGCGQRRRRDDNVDTWLEAGKASVVMVNPISVQPKAPTSRGMTSGAARACDFGQDAHIAKAEVAQSWAGGQADCVEPAGPTQTVWVVLKTCGPQTWRSSRHCNMCALDTADTPKRRGGASVPNCCSWAARPPQVALPES